MLRKVFVLGPNPLFFWYVAFVSHFEAGVLRRRSGMLGAGWISEEVQTFDAAVAPLQQWPGPRQEKSAAGGDPHRAALFHSPMPGASEPLAPG